MAGRRVDRLNSLLREVLSEVIRRDVRHPDVNELVTVTRVEITSDLRYAKVHVSVIGEDATRQKTLNALSSAAGFVAVNASKKVTMRYFPELTFYLDTGVDKQMRVEEILTKIQHERESLQIPPSNVDITDAIDTGTAD